VSDLNAIRDVLHAAVMRGAVEVLEVRRSCAVNPRIKYGKELVTEADERSDAAIRAVFERELTRIDPEIAFRLEESGGSASAPGKEAGADPLDGTAHFACGGNLYAVQAHYVEDGVPLVGVVFQPEAFLPLYETDACEGRIVSAIRSAGSFVERTRFTGGGFAASERRRVTLARHPRTEMFVACVPFSTKMNAEARESTWRVHEAGIIAATTGVGCAGGNVLMAIFGGHHVYANIGAGEDLDLIPAQVIAEEAGMTVWGLDRKPPVWKVRKQPVIFAPDAETAAKFLCAAEPR
jgi:3'-phosphoadenosine 5'-phosphosulfate (PAPS) 3'-phosphatase